MVWILEGCLMRCISEYNKKISIQQLTGTADDHGFIDNTLETNWTEYEAAYASVESKGGREFWKNQQVVADVSHIWRCQWTRKLDVAGPEMRIVCEGITYEIISVEDVDLAHREMEIRTKRAV